MDFAFRSSFAILALLLNIAPTTGFFGPTKIPLRNRVKCSVSAAASADSEEQRSDYIARQREAFDESAVFFASEAAVPPEVKPCLERIAAATVRSVGGGRAVARLLDVGTGAGVLLPYFMAEGVAPQAITGIDVSPRMLANAASLYPDSTFFEADFLGPIEDILQPPRMAVDPESAVAAVAAGVEEARVAGSTDAVVDNDALRFDAVVLNACFANIGPDPRAVLAQAARLCRSQGTLKRQTATSDPPSNPISTSSAPLDEATVAPHFVDLGNALGVVLDDDLVVLEVELESQMPRQALGFRVASVGGFIVASSQEFKAALGELRASGAGSAVEVTYSMPPSQSGDGYFVGAGAGDDQGGVVVVSHPFGSAFCHGLASDDGLVAKTSLPNRRALEKLLEGLPLSLEHFEDDTAYVWRPGAQSRRGMYLAVLRVTGDVGK